MRYTEADSMEVDIAEVVGHCKETGQYRDQENSKISIDHVNMEKTITSKTEEGFRNEQQASVPSKRLDNWPKMKNADNARQVQIASQAIKDKV